MLYREAIRNQNDQNNYSNPVPVSEYSKGTLLD